MIAYFRDKNRKSRKKKKYQSYKTLKTIIKSIEIFVIIGATLISISLSTTGFGLVIVPASACKACDPSLGNKFLYERVLKEYNNFKKLYERDQQTIKSFDKFYRKSLRRGQRD